MKTQQHKLREMLEKYGFTIVQEEVKVMTSEKEVHKFSLFVVKK